MYYAKFTNGQLIYSYNSTKVYIYSSNNIVYLDFYTTSSNLCLLKEGIIKGNIIYVPLDKSKYGYYEIKAISSDNINAPVMVSTYTLQLVDDSFVNYLEVPFYIMSYLRNITVVIPENPNTISTYYGTLSVYTYTSTSAPKIYQYAKGDSINLSELIKKFVYNGSYNSGNNLSSINGYITCTSGTSYSSGTGCRMIYTKKNIISLGNITDDCRISTSSTTNPDKSYLSKLYIYNYNDYNEFTSIQVGYSSYTLTINNDLDSSIYDVSYLSSSPYTFIIIKGTTKTDLIDLSTDNVVICFCSPNYIETINKTFYMININMGNIYCIGQDTYTPTNKLKTPTFSSIEVLHNEDTGTYALTFSANNPNEVSISVDIVISGRSGVDTITLPVGMSEWSFAIAENKAGTIQGTNINAYGYENADDTSKYNYYEWVAPGYLRELVIYLYYLSTTDDKNYTLNVAIENPNSVDIPCIIHYGKNGEKVISKTLNPSINIFAFSGVENVNGIVWIHPEKVGGYYQLPDTDAVSYTKLPIPPTPSSTGITLYKNNNNNKVVNKGYKLETYKVLNGTFRDSVNILNPVFQIENDEVPECNYCYIADFRRYYYIDTITCIRTGLYEIECSVDVLYTYKDSILNSEQYISRQENEYNELLQDSYVTFKDDYYYRIYFKPIEEFDYAIYDTDYNSKTNIVVETFGK